MDIAVINLIEAVKRHPLIYDASQLEFKNPDKKEKSWQIIGNNINASGDICKKRWRTLRERYTRELKRLKYDPSGQRERSTWEYYEAMQFLQEHIKYRRSQKIVFKNDGPSILTSAMNPISDQQLQMWAADIKPDNNRQTPDTQPERYAESPAHNEATSNDEEQNAPSYYSNDIPANDTKEPEAHQLLNTRQSLKRGIEERDVVPSSSSTSAGVSSLLRGDEDDFFCTSVACSLRKLSRINNMKTKVEIYKVLEKAVALEEGQKNQE